MSASEHSRRCLRAPHLFCFSSSVVLRVEFGRTPCRVRFASASKSVVLRIEIGSNSCRVRSTFGSSVRECATPTSPGVCRHREHEDAATHAIEHRPRRMRAAAEPARNGAARLIRPQPREPPHRGPPHPGHSPCLRCTDTTISTQNRTDLEPEVNRSQCGNGPISARVSTDLDGGGARRGCAGLHRVASCTLLARSPQGLGGMRADGRTVEAWLL